MKFRCASGKHFFNAEDKADNCPTCRRSTDLAVKRYFKRQSNEMLRDAEVETRGGERYGTHSPLTLDPVWKSK